MTSAVHQLLSRQQFTGTMRGVVACFMNAAARVLTGTRKFDRCLMQLMHDNLHWLEVPECIKYKVIILTHRFLISTAPWYLAADCVPASEMAQRCYLRSAAGHQLVPSYCLNSCGLQAFSVLGPRMELFA